MFPTQKDAIELADLCVVSPRSLLSAGFTLIELLVVIVILAILVAITAPAIPSLLGARGVARGVDDVASVLEVARTEAMARHAYVYVGFENTTNASGNAELCVAAAASPDGSFAMATGLIPITKVVRLENVRQTNYSALPQVVREAAASATNDAKYVAEMTSSGVIFTNGRQVFSKSMIIVSPEGELLSSGTSPVFLERACVGLVGMRGASPMNNNGGIVTFDGGSGAITITRP